MNPAEVQTAIAIFQKRIASVHGDELLDLWIEHSDKADRVPDLDLLKSLVLEQALQSEFGFGKWLKAVAARREAKDANRT